MPKGLHETKSFHSVIEAFTASVALHRHETAVICGGESLSYNQLQLRSNALASQLRVSGVQPGDLVGVCSERRIEMVVALLGILKAGAAYVPFDSSYPAAKLQEMAADAGIELLLGDNQALDTENFEQIKFEQFPKTKKFRGGIEIDGESLAYVMFTSGSTGKPKGVEVPHRAILRLVIDQNYCDLSPGETILQHSPVAFDASTFEIWGALLNGGKLVILPETGTSLRVIGEAIREYNITTMWLTAGLFHAIVDERPEDLLPLRQLLTGGDVVSPKRCRELLQRHPKLKLINGYGPTENTTFTCCHSITLDQVKDDKPIPIGTPISGTRVQIIDGELCASGDGLALGYRNNDELTKEKFIQYRGEALYLTGDQVLERADGVIEFIGRIDQQVKIRGFRIELSEIESAILDINQVSKATVIAEAIGDATDKALIAHYVSDTEIKPERFKSELEEKLPQHCIPAFYQRIDQLPLNANGKVDRKALVPLSEIVSVEAETSPLKPTQKILCDAFSEVLELPNIPIKVNFFDLGASSLQIARVHEKVQVLLDKELPVTDFFRFTTIQSLAKHLSQEPAEQTPAQQSKIKESTTDFIAIIGLAGRFPGAPDVDTFWDNLIEGRETISRFTAEELDFENATGSEDTYVRARGIIDESDHFDAQHFNIPPREANELDPQHRIMLECAQTVLENSGHDPDRFDGKIGVFCGSSQNSYLLNNLCQNREFAQGLAAGYPTNNFNALLGNDKDFLPTRIAYKLNLKGPAVSVQCACSTSLVSVAQACESLRSGTSDMALAGGISLGYPQKRDYLYTPDGIASIDGHCRTFDEQATGTVFGEGAGLVALRRLDDAIADGDNVIAVIRGFAINNDGSDKAGYTAPSINGQVDVIREAQQKADVTADTIGYIEAHGTATPLGDPIEVAALNAAFSETTQEKHFCYIGTGKTNVGHLDIAAGITGLIKTALTVQKGTIPPLLHFENPNPNIDFENSPFVPVKELTDWKPESPRRAGVSAFGVGGTNVHMILEESPVNHDLIVSSPTLDSIKSSILPLSASSPAALEQAFSELSSFAAGNTDLNLNAAASTLQKGRRNFDHRAVIVANSVAGVGSAKFTKSILAGQYNQVAFMFPGQGAQHPGMAQDLYKTEAVFKQALDQCAEIIKNATDVDLLDLLFPEPNDSAAMAEKLKNTSIAQPAIFSIEYALAQQWEHWGITPACMVGHSIGEFAAACIAGVFAVEDALSLVCLRGRLMSEVPSGTMISVRASVDEIEPFLTEEINLAAVNGASSCVIAGPFAAADKVEIQLAEAGLEAKRLYTSHAFHSTMMEPIVAKFEKEVGKLKLNPPQIPILSTVTNEWMTAEVATEPHYWAAHLRKPVRFFQSIQKLWEQSDHILLEVGPGRTLATLAGQNPDRKNAQPSLASLPHPAKQDSPYQHIRTTLGTLWCHGLQIDWDLAELQSSNPGRIPLPTYPFQRKRFWIEPDSQSVVETPVPNTITQQPMTLASPTSGGVSSTLKEVLSELSGIDPSEIADSASFLELGFDSLLLTQVGKEIYDTFKVKVSLRQLIDDFSSPAELTAHLEQHADPSTLAPIPQKVAAPQQPQMPAMPMAGYAMVPAPPVPGMPQAYYPVPYPGFAEQPQLIPAPIAPAPVEKQATVSGPTTVIDRSKCDEELTKSQKAHIDRLVFRYTEKTKTSKELTQKYRKAHADPRTASGFNRIWKEMVYQIVTKKSKGSRLLDVDGNEYIDILNGFGPGFLGHSADFLVEAVENQLHQGYEVGPQSLLAMEAAELFCEVTGNERTSFVCTGSEAVQAAMRLARTVTKRDKIVIFARDYHGNFDEVLVRGVNNGGNLKSLPTAPGIPKASAGNMIVLPYGTDESLEIIRGMADELAAVIVEPVQSRRPEFRPRDFIREVREITTESGALFVFDEVVTGFRFGPRGAQEFYGVEADLCTYGKVIGGGMPLGVVSGKSEYMDTFDGGMWEYGDDSFPDQPVTFFAGTFVRHPLAMASVKAMLEFFKAQPLHFWNQVNSKGDKLAGTVDQFFKDNSIPMEMPNCGSLMFVRMGDGQKYGNLFFYHLREKGVFMLEGFPSYMTAAHSDEDIDYAIAAFKESAYEMQSAGFFQASDKSKDFNGPTLFGPPAILRVESKPNREITPATDSVKKFLAPLTVPTTEPQREILLASRLDERSSCAFNESASLTFKGNLNTKALDDAFKTLIARHDAIRSTFSRDGVTMTVHPEIDLLIEKIDLTGKDKNQLAAILHVDASTPYDLENGPLVRPMLFKIAEDEHVFAISAHHLVCDGWSYNVIAEELCTLYNANCSNHPHCLELPKQYIDHAKEVAISKGGEQHRAQQEFWLEQFSDPPEPIELPLDRAYPLNRTFQGATYEYRIGKETYEAIKRAGAKQGSTLYSTLAAAYQLLIHRITGQDDIVVCIPAAGQNDGINTENLVGHCVNFLPLRSRFDKESGFDQFLTRSRKTLLAATDNRSFTYGELIQNLDLERDPRRMPLLEVAFNVERMDYFGDWQNLDVRFEPNGKTHVHYTMFMNIVESKDGLRIDVDYNTDVLDEDTIAMWAGYFETLLRSIINDPKGKVSELSLMDQATYRKVTYDWNYQNSTGVFPEESVHHLFEKIARSHPHDIALTSEAGTVTYQELDEHANAVAVALNKRGVKPGDFVAIAAHRSHKIVAAILGVLKAGAAYAPIDPDYPEDRIIHMLEDCGANIILHDDSVKFDTGKKIKKLSLNDVVATRVPTNFKSYQGASDDLAYVIYTSGSTGKPKGTLIPHRAIVRLVRNTNYMEFDADQVFLLSAPISFDASTLELWGPLLNGAKLALMPDGTPGLREIGDAIQKFEVTSLWLTSGLFSLMVDERPDDLLGLKQLLAGGDVLSKEHVAKALNLLSDDVKLINGYGPTENTTFTTCHHIQPSDAEGSSIPIGRPIGHTQCYILDESMHPVPPMVKGRLYIGGDGLALGYLNQPELTLKKFVATPFSGASDERLYDSGDECRWLKDGTIEFIGRADRQVKLRGFRIEPGEIENALAEHGEINEAIVRIVGNNSSNKSLIAYITTSSDLDVDKAEKFAESRLPNYMVPSAIIPLDTFPLTANGKIDYRLLPLPEFAKSTPRTGDLTPTQKVLAGIWDEVLECGDIDIDSNFFKIGGNSLAGLNLFMKIHNELGVDLPLATLFQAPTIALLSDIVDDRAAEKTKISIVSKVSNGKPGNVPLFLIHGGDGGTLFYKDFIENIEGYREIYTVEAPMSVDRNINMVKGSIEEISTYYIEQIYKEFSGKRIAIGGYSFGGILAYDLAGTMVDQGIEVEKLFLFDTNNPVNEENYRNRLSEWARSGWENLDGDTFQARLNNAGLRLSTKIQERSEKNKFRSLIKNYASTMAEMDDHLRMVFINDAHNRVMQKYRPKPYDGETYLFRAQASRFSFNEEMGWQDLIPNLTVKNIKGRHQDIFLKPYVDILIEEFNQIFSMYA